ncbi:hypothetical protein Hanom_Chr17g01577401 [Helianthus anomalus]
MASKTSESSSAQKSFDALYCKWGTILFNNLLQVYDIKSEWNPVLSSKKDTTFPLKSRKINLFSIFFKFRNFRLPITKFCKSVLDEYQINISQIHPLGLVKLRHFEFACIALGHIPEIVVFRAFLILVWKCPFLRSIDETLVSKEKFKDDGPPADAYFENALFKRLSQRLSECQVIPEGALVKARMSLLWRNSRLYPAFQRFDNGEWTLFDFIDPPRHAALRFADRVVGEQEADVGVSLEETKKPSRIRVTVKKVDTAGTTASPVATSVSTTSGDVVATSAPAMVSLRPVPKSRKIMPSFSTFQADSLAEAQVESGSSIPLTYGEIVSSAASGQSVPLADLISQASAVLIGSSMPLPLFTTSVIMTPNPVTMPLFSSSILVSIFDSPIGDFPVFGKEMPTTFARGESTSAKDTTVSDIGGSGGPFAENVACFFDVLYLPTVCWDPYIQDKCYQTKWKIAESSKLVFPPVVYHWVEREYPPAESAYVEGLDHEHLIILQWWMLSAADVRESRFVLEKNKAEDNLKRVTAILVEEMVIWAHDIVETNRILSRAKTFQEELERKAVNEARKVRSELSAEVEKFRIDTNFVYRVQERYQNLTLELEPSNAKAQAKQVELEERKEKLKELQQMCDSLVSEKNQLLQSSTTQQACLREAESALEHFNAEVDRLTSRLAGLQGDRNWLISQGLVGAFKYLRQSESFVALLDCLSTAAYKSDHHDGVHEGYVSCHQTSKVTPDFQEKGGKLTAEMADALEAVYNDPLPVYADLADKVAEDGVDSLRHMLEVADEFEDE